MLRWHNENIRRWRSMFRSRCFKVLALGADGVLICRTSVTAFYGGAEEGGKVLLKS
jgi:hypothetical protein